MEICLEHLKQNYQAEDDIATMIESRLENLKE